MNRRDKTYIAVGSGDFLYRLGIKTILSVIGLESELIETSHYDTLKTYVSDDEVDYFIITEDILPTVSLKSLNDFIALVPNKHVLLIGETIKEAPADCSLIDRYAEQKEVLEHFQSFFFKDTHQDTHQGQILTEREIDVLRHVALGLSNKEMADRLFISTNTVITHRKNITDKLGIKTIPGLTVYAIMNGVITPDEVKY